MEYLIFTCIGNEFNIAMGITELHYAWSLTPGQGMPGFEHLLRA